MATTHCRGYAIACPSPCLATALLQAPRKHGEGPFFSCVNVLASARGDSMKVKTLNNQECDVVALDPAGAFGVIVGVLGRVIVEAGEFPRKGKVYLYQKVSETPDQYMAEYDVLAKNCTDLIIPTLEEMLINDGAVIGQADYELVDGEDGNVYMRFTDIRQYDTRFEIDENGILNINTEIGPYGAEIVDREYRFVIPKLGEFNEWSFKCLEPAKPTEDDAPMWEELKASDAYALGYVKAEELLLKNAFALWGDAGLYEEAEERIEKDDEIPSFIAKAPVGTTQEEKVIAMAAFLAACEERIKDENWRETADEVEPIIDKVFSFYFLLPSLRDSLKSEDYKGQINYVSKD